jgi:hypothetical protein
MKLILFVLLLINTIYCQTSNELLIYESDTVDNLLLDMDSKITTYLADKKINQIHKEFIYWEKFPPIEIIKEHLSPFRLIDQTNALNGIQYIEYKLIENFKLTDQELFQYDVYERFGFGKHNGRLITFVIHIEYSENTFDRGFFTTIVTNGLKKCNNILKTAKNIVNETAKLFIFNYGGYKVQLSQDDHEIL